MKAAGDSSRKTDFENNDVLSKTKHEVFKNFPPSNDNMEVGGNNFGGDASENESEDDFIEEMSKDDDLGSLQELKKEAERE